MQRSLLLAALVAGIAFAPIAAAAQSMTGSGAMGGAHGAMMGASTMWMCHATKSGEKTTAVTADGKQNLTCKTVDVTKLMAGPSMSPGMSADATNTAWKDFLERQVSGQY